MAFRFSILFSFSTTDIAVGLTSLYIKKKISKGGQSKRRRERIKSFDILLTSKKEQTYFNTLLRTNVPSFSSGFSVIIGLFLYMYITCKFLCCIDLQSEILCAIHDKNDPLFYRGKSKFQAFGDCPKFTLYVVLHPSLLHAAAWRNLKSSMLGEKVSEKRP